MLYGRIGRDGSDLGILLLNPVEDRPVCRVAKATVSSFLLVVLVSLTEPLWAEIVGVPEWFVDAGKGVVAGHENLQPRKLAHEIGRESRVTYPFECRRACPRVGCYKDGFFRHLRNHGAVDGKLYSKSCRTQAS